MTVLMDGVKTTRELPIKGCRECRFSVGGHLFAATDPQQHTIHVWSTYTGKHVAELSRHANRIWHIEWSADDLRLTSSSSDGMIVEWDMRTFHPLRVHQTRGMYYTAAVLSLDNRAIFAVGSDKGIKEIGESARPVAEFPLRPGPACESARHVAEFSLHSDPAFHTCRVDSLQGRTGKRCATRRWRKSSRAWR